MTDIHQPTGLARQFNSTRSLDEIEAASPRASSPSEHAKDKDEKDSAVVTQEIPAHTEGDAVWGEIDNTKINYRGLSFWGAYFLMTKTQIGIGVLSFPFVLQVLGLIPGLILLFFIGGVTTWSDLYIGDIKKQHPSVYALDDVGYVLFGKMGKVVFGCLLVAYYLIVGGPTLAALSIALNGVSAHATCTAVFTAVGAIAIFLASSIQTMSKLSWVGAVGCLSVLLAIMTLTVAAGVQDRPAAAPQTGPWDKEFHLIGSPSTIDALAALGTLVFTVCGTPGFFPIVSEMAEPRLYKRAVWLCQGTILFLNFLVGTVVYYFCGQYVTSPSPGSAGPLMKRIVYGLALPGVLGGAVMIIHVCAKYIFVSTMRKSRHLASKTWQHYAIWLGCTAGCTFVSYIIASAVPSFSILTALGGSLLGPFVSIQPYGLYLFKTKYSQRHKGDRQWVLGAIVGATIFGIGTFLQISGTYGAFAQIAADVNAGARKPFTCADNSGTVAS